MCWIESRWEKPDDFIPHTGNLLSSKASEKSLGTLEESKSSDVHSDSDGEKEAEKREVSTETQKLKIKFKVGSWFILYKSVSIYEKPYRLTQFSVEAINKAKIYVLATR